MQTISTVSSSHKNLETDKGFHSLQYRIVLPTSLSLTIDDLQGKDDKVRKVKNRIMKKVRNQEVFDI